MAAAVQSGNRGLAGTDIAPYSQHVGDFFTGLLSVLVKGVRPIYSAGLGMADLSGAKSRESRSESPPAAPVARSQQAAHAYCRISRFAGSLRGGGYMATALVDLYGGEDFERFDRVILP